MLPARRPESPGARALAAVLSQLADLRSSGRSRADRAAVERNGRTVGGGDRDGVSCDAFGALVRREQPGVAEHCARCRNPPASSLTSVPS